MSAWLQNSSRRGLKLDRLTTDTSVYFVKAFWSLLEGDALKVSLYVCVCVRACVRVCVTVCVCVCVVCITAACIEPSLIILAAIHPQVEFILYDSKNRLTLTFYTVVHFVVTSFCTW